jgi:uncharacterized protein (DUF2345 family)
VKAVSEAVGGDESTAGQGQHFGEALIGMSAKDGFAANAAQSLQIANGDAVTLISGHDVQFISGQQMRVHSGQAVGLLGGAIKSGSNNVGLQIIAAKDGIDIQAQAGELKVQARDQIDVISANAHIDWAAAKSITLSTAGGASIVIDGGNITVQCPGKITVNASKKSLIDPEKLTYSMPEFPSDICVDCLKKSLGAGLAFTTVA